MDSTLTFYDLLLSRIDDLQGSERVISAISHFCEICHIFIPHSFFLEWPISLQSLWQGYWALETLSSAHPQVASPSSPAEPCACWRMGQWPGCKERTNHSRKMEPCTKAKTRVSYVTRDFISWLVLIIYWPEKLPWSWCRMEPRKEIRQQHSRQRWTRRIQSSKLAFSVPIFRLA